MAWRATGVGGEDRSGACGARWQENTGDVGLWEAVIGPFADGDLVRYDALVAPRKGALRETLALQVVLSRTALQWAMTNGTSRHSKKAWPCPC